MGNAGGACCSGSQADRCCKSGVAKPEAGASGGSPVTKAQPSCEVLGVEPTPPPGINSLVNFGPDGEKADGADTAAGKANVVTCKDGSTYEGQMSSSGLREGYGIRKSLTSEYVGEWKADQQHGKGKQKWTDGRVYEGQFDEGRFSGEGRMVWSTPKGLLVYEGQYRDDLKHGMGKFVWADGRTYEGEWCCGKRHGRGRYVNARSEQKVGYWLDDKFDRWEADNANMNGTPALTANVPQS